MHSEIPAMVNNLKRLTLPELQREYANLCGEPTRIAHKGQLVKRIIWRMQAQREGDLSERAKRRAAELADDASIRLRPAVPTTRDANSITAAFIPGRPKIAPPVGTVLRREYKGSTVLVRVLERGYEFDGERYRSLTAITRKVTGSHWSGYDFFGIKPSTKSAAKAAKTKGDAV